jgi:molecular chaperone GrpE (heat shock protein)
MIKNQIDVKDQMIDKLHVELAYYKQEEAERYVNQVMKDLIKVRKDLKKVICSKKWENMTIDDFKREYMYVFDDLTDLLEQHNIDEYITEPGMPFDASKHQAKIEITQQFEYDKTVKTSLSEGYVRDGKVIIPERVLVYQFKGEEE